MKHPSFYQILIVSIFLFSGTANRTTAQQTSITDVIDYRDIDGKSSLLYPSITNQLILFSTWLEKQPFYPIISIHFP